jgi:hypothetical protein
MTQLEITRRRNSPEALEIGALQPSWIIPVREEAQTIYPNFGNDPTNRVCKLNGRFGSCQQCITMFETKNRIFKALLEDKGKARKRADNDLLLTIQEAQEKVREFYLHDKFIEMRVRSCEACPDNQPTSSPTT